MTFFNFVLKQYLKHSNLYLIYRIYIFHISDINECTAGTDDCSANAACTNTDGGFDCTCNPGFTDTRGDGTLCHGKFNVIPISIYRINDSIGQHYFLYTKTFY